MAENTMLLISTITVSPSGWNIKQETRHTAKYVPPTGCPFYRVSEYGRFTALETGIGRDVLRNLPPSETP